MIVGDKSLELVHLLYQAAVTHQQSILGQVVIRLDPDGYLTSRRPSLAAMKASGSNDPTVAAAAYICRHRSCSAPVYSPEDLRHLLDSQ